MRVHAEVYPPSLGRVMYRINRAIKRHAPPEVRFVPRPEEADLQIIDAVGTGFIGEGLRHKEFVLLMHTWKTAGESPSWWTARFREARLVVSFHDLPALAGTDGFAFYRMPWGVDPHVFTLPREPQQDPRPLAVLTTGYCDGQEAIRECHEAARRVGLGSAHLNQQFPWMWPEIERKDGISDGALCDLYQRCRYVSGLRRMEGFELPVVEGMACGCRPICFDQPTARYWFGEHALFVPEDDFARLTACLEALFSSPVRTVDKWERLQVVGRFAWSNIIPAFWKRVLA